MRNRIEAYIPKAIEAIEACGIAKNGEVPKQFNGYISSFGASIRQAGLVATVLFFRGSTGSEESREKVVEAVERIIDSPLLDAQGRLNGRIARDQVEDAATALKLAVRTFRLVDKKEE
jgi:CRISPR-associated protein Cmr5